MQYTVRVDSHDHLHTVSTSTPSQVGFSGDVNDLTWANLAYQPYFSSTAANVLYGYWSHDIEGPADDHEMCVSLPFYLMLN